MGGDTDKEVAWPALATRNWQMTCQIICPLVSFWFDSGTTTNQNSGENDIPGAGSATVEIRMIVQGGLMRLIYAPSRRLGTIVTVVVAAGLSGCVTDAYVEPAQPVIAAGQLPAVQDPKPVTVLFQWLTNGKENPGAAAQMKGRVLSAVAESRMFSRVSPTVDSSQANILTISIDDRADIGKSEAKGFGTGLTLGLVGSLARDDYVCKADYTSAGKTVSAEARDTLLTAVGAHATPTGLKPVKPLDGINEIVDQLVWHSLGQLDSQGALEGVSR